MIDATGINRMHNPHHLSKKREDLFSKPPEEIEYLG